MPVVFENLTHECATAFAGTADGETEPGLRGVGRNRLATRGVLMEKWRCTPCDYVYDPEPGDPDNGIAPGTPWEEVPDDWLCPEW
jgi:rubredoxin